MKISKIMATASAVALIVFSCKSNLAEADKIDLSTVPLQTVENMFAVQTENGYTKMRIEAKRMEGYENDTSRFEVFPEGFSVFTYLQDGRMETRIDARQARHIMSKKGSHPEVWQAFGNVVIKNVIKNEMMETDTLYWDQGKHEIYTDCYVKMTSPDGLMQGYGMRSDDRARNAILRKPFDSFSVTEKDTTRIMVDSVNFIGPFKQKQVKNKAVSKK